MNILVIKNNQEYEVNGKKILRDLNGNIITLWPLCKEERKALQIILPSAVKPIVKKQTIVDFIWN